MVNVPIFAHFLWIPRGDPVNSVKTLSKGECGKTVETDRGGFSLLDKLVNIPRSKTVVAPWTCSYITLTQNWNATRLRRQDRGFTMKTPYRVSQLHRGLVEFVEAPRNDCGGAVDMIPKKNLYALQIALDHRGNVTFPVNKNRIPLTISLGPTLGQLHHSILNMAIRFLV